MASSSIEPSDLRKTDSGSESLLSRLARLSDRSRDTLRRVPLRDSPPPLGPGFLTVGICLPPGEIHAEQMERPLRLSQRVKNLLLFLAVTLSAQTPPAFEVASIKPNTSGGGGSSIRASTGRITMDNVHLKKVTLWAYGIPDDREYALAGPDWLTTGRFNIQATFPPDTQPQQVRLMTRTLLAARFKLALHRETRQMAVYALVPGKNGPKLRAAEDGEARTSGGLG